MADAPRDPREDKPAHERLRDIAAALRDRASRTSPAAAQPGDATTDYGELRAQVRTEVEARRAGYAQSHGTPLRLPRIEPRAIPEPAGEPAEPIGIRNEYELADLMIYENEEFVRNVYRALLHRDPEPEGLSGHLRQLTEHGQSKIELLHEFASSEEGRRVGVRVRGLARAVRIRRWRGLPVVGRIIAILVDIASLPHTVRRLERHEALLYRRQRELVDAEEAVNRFAARTAEAIDALGEAVAGVEREKASNAAAQSLTGRFVALQEEVARIQGGVERRTTDSLVARFATEAHEAISRLSARVEETREPPRRRIPSLEKFYVAFEDRFRGEREEIKKRVQIYVPIVSDARAGTPDAAVVDIGCGRGEWLEVLRESNLVARGVDTNAIMVDTARGLGLDVALHEGVAYLESLAPDSLGAVSALQVIEHLEFESQIRLLDAALRALRPGGVLILETPNPENINVGACTFWNDPTHIHPVPPEPLRAMAELRGFGRTQVMPLHPYPFSAHLPGGAGEPVRDVINHQFFGPQDYAMVAFKP